MNDDQCLMEENVEGKKKNLLSYIVASVRT